MFPPAVRENRRIFNHDDQYRGWLKQPAKKDYETSNLCHFNTTRCEFARKRMCQSSRHDARATGHDNDYDTYGGDGRAAAPKSGCQRARDK